MSITEPVGSVTGLWRFPVKSMRGEQLQDAELTERGVLGDRAYALIETDTGKVVSAKSVKHFPDLLCCKAKFVEPPRRGGYVPPAQITLPDGTSVTSDSGDVDRVLSAYFKRNVRLGRVAPDDFTIDQYHPDVEGADPGGNRDTVVAQKLGAALFAALGMESPVPVGSFFDVFPLTVLTTSTLARLNELWPQSRFDERRFRMNVIVKTERPGFVENDWVGHELGLGYGTRLNVALLDPRCVMTTLAQDDLPDDTDVLRTLVRHNRVQVGDLGLYPCAGVYAVVAAPGTVRIGDRVVLS
ncbi:MAG TPA: MOSC N-terminal beta barrel domain-containing protein [Candidatus Binatia bacterium]|nr:MOSC N-terminal beta barrel domain-containing protein [Candidatus Binatia bacterium]